MMIQKSLKTKAMVVEMYTALEEILELQVTLKEVLFNLYQEVQEFQVRLAK